jgi:hypothetical protein
MFTCFILFYSFKAIIIICINFFCFVSNLVGMYKSFNCIIQKHIEAHAIKGGEHGLAFNILCNVQFKKTRALVNNVIR